MADGEQPGGGGPEGGGEKKPPATVGQVRAIIRRKLRQHAPHEETSLNIYPMMDMMTILLVFLVMQFAASAADVMPSDELLIPYSTSELELEPAITIQLSRSEISVEGDFVLSLNAGKVDASQKQGGGTGFLINPLLTVMEQHRERLKLIAQNNSRRPFKGSVRIIADKRTPFRTLSEVIYTLGQAEFNKMHFVALKK